MDPSPEDWLNEDLLSSALQGDKKYPKVKIINFSVKPAAAGGDNYCSKVYRVKLNYQLADSVDVKTKSLVVKAPIVTEAVNEIKDQFDLNDSEAVMYNTIFPKMYSKLKTKFSPKTYFCKVEGVFVMEDLCSEGYSLCDKFNQLDYEHCKATFECLAKYHAISVSCHHDDPLLIEDVGKEKVFIADSPVVSLLRPFITFCVTYLGKILNELEGQREVAEYFLSRADNIWESLCDICRPKLNRINVLNHGDFWTNNMLFKQVDAGKVFDVKFIDFQLPRYMTPAIDLTYFLWTSVNEDVRENKQEALFQTYIKTFNQTLEDLGCKERLTSEDLEEDLSSTTDFDIVAIAFLRLLMLCEPEYVTDPWKFKPEDFSNGVVEDEFMRMYQSKRYRALLPGVARDMRTWLLSKGLLPL